MTGACVRKNQLNWDGHWPPVYRIHITKAQARAILRSFDCMLKDGFQMHESQGTKNKLIAEGLMNPDGSLTREGLNIHGRLSEQVNRDTRVVRQKIEQAEHKQEQLKLVLRALEQAGYTLRGGLFASPMKPETAEEAVYLLERAAEADAERRPLLTRSARQLSVAIRVGDVKAALAGLLVDKVIAGVDCIGAPDRFVLHIPADQDEAFGKAEAAMDAVGFRWIDAEQREDGAMVWHLFEPKEAP